MLASTCGASSCDNPLRTRGPRLGANPEPVWWVGQTCSEKAISTWVLPSHACCRCTEVRLSACLRVSRKEHQAPAMWPVKTEHTVILACAFYVNGLLSTWVRFECGLIWRSSLLPQCQNKLPLYRRPQSSHMLSRVLTAIPPQPANLQECRWIWYQKSLCACSACWKQLAITSAHSSAEAW